MRRLTVTLAFLAACGGNPLDPGAEEVFAEPGELPEGKEDGAGGNVELKVTVRSDQIDLATSRFKLSKSRAERRWVWFYDTRGLDLFQRGLVLRARKVQDGADDSTVKVRPLARSRVASSWFRVSGFKCETDRVGGKSIESCSLTVGQDRGEIDDVAARKRVVDKLFSSEQEGFAGTYSPPSPAWSGLSALGPTDAWVWKVKTSAFSPGLTAERWELPGGPTLLELSTKVPASQSATVEKQLRAYLSARGIDPSSEGETKTRATLEFWSRR